MGSEKGPPPCLSGRAAGVARARALPRRRRGAPSSIAARSVSPVWMSGVVYLVSGMSTDAPQPHHANSLKYAVIQAMAHQHCWARMWLAARDCPGEALMASTTSVAADVAMVEQQSRPRATRPVRAGGVGAGYRSRSWSATVHETLCSCSSWDD